jgi:hypothetical protein
MHGELVLWGRRPRPATAATWKSKPDGSHIPMTKIARLIFAFFTASPSTRIAQLEEDVRELRRTLHTNSEASAAPGSTSAQDELEPVPSAAQLAADMGLAMPARKLGGIEISPGDHFELIDR